MSETRLSGGGVSSFICRIVKSTRTGKGYIKHRALFIRSVSWKNIDRTSGEALNNTEPDSREKLKRTVFNAIGMDLEFISRTRDIKKKCYRNRFGGRGGFILARVCAKLVPEKAIELKAWNFSEIMERLKVQSWNWYFVWASCIFSRKGIFFFNRRFFTGF